MKTVFRILSVIVLLAALWFLIQMIASETGEVVVLTSTDSLDKPVETRLWLVEHEGAWYLRAGHAQAGWYQQILAQPQIKLERNAQNLAYTAQPQAELKARINQLMRDKYGWRDAYISFFFSRDAAIPVLLETTQ